MILEARQLGKSYKKRRVIKDVSITVSSGEIVGILGPNGAGKTTTFYMIMGSIQPDIGSIHLGNVDITPLPMYQRARLGMSYLPQEPSIFRGLSVEENVMAVLEIVESDKEKRIHKLEELLGDFSISHLRYAEALSLSGGERRRVEIARALATNPKFILMDEPLAGIDPIAVSEIKDLILKLKEKGIGVLVTDHNVRETLSIVDKAYIIHDGIVFAKGTPKEIIKDKKVKEIYLGDTFQ